jgi:hypothetical protein
LSLIVKTEDVTSMLNWEVADATQSYADEQSSSIVQTRTRAAKASARTTPGMGGVGRKKRRRKKKRKKKKKKTHPKNLDAVGAAAGGQGWLVTHMLEHANKFAVAALGLQQRPATQRVGLRTQSDIENGGSKQRETVPDRQADR